MLIDPSPSQWSQLSPPLTTGERRVADALCSALPEGWDVYVRPKLNGLRPSLVALSASHPVTVLQVRDAVQDIDFKDELERLKLIRAEIQGLYCPRRDTKGFPVQVVTLVVCPQESRESLKDWLSHHSRNDNLQFVSGEQFFSDIAEAISLRQETPLGDVSFRDLRSWLLEPNFARIRRERLELDANQRRLARDRTDTGYRRIKGPAGSGKTQVLASRAAQLATEGKTVLFVTFNITLLNYVRECALRWSLFDGELRSSEPVRGITFLNYHAWCQRILTEVGAADAYRSFWAAFHENQRDESDHNDALDSVLEEQLPDLVIRKLHECGDSARTYDAIVVDEAQDYEPKWWQSLRLVCREGGEMVLAADATQDLYEKGAKWTDEAMSNAGFTGPWTQLRFSYRTPPDLVRLTTAFASEFLPPSQVDLPSSQAVQPELFPCNLRWVQVSQDSYAQACVKEVAQMVVHADPSLLAIPDVVFIADSNKSGM